MIFVLRRICVSKSRMRAGFHRLRNASIVIYTKFFLSRGSIIFGRNVCLQHHRNCRTLTEILVFRLAELLQKLILPCSFSPWGERITSPQLRWVAMWTTNFLFPSWTSSIHSPTGMQRCDSGGCKTHGMTQGGWESRGGDTRVSSFSWESGRQSTGICVPGSHRIFFDRGLRMWGSPQESAHALGCGTSPCVLISAGSISPSFSTKYFTVHEEAASECVVF